MISKKEFINYCNSLISQKDVNKHHQRNTLMWTILIVFWACALASAIYIATINPNLIIPVIVATIIFSSIIFKLTGYNYNKLKDKNINKILEHLLSGYKYSYDKKGYISKDIFNKSSFKTPQDSYTGEDLLEINIPNDDNTPSDVVMRLSDLLVTTRSTDSDGDSHTTTQYSGVFGYIKFNFEFKCNLCLNTQKSGLKKIKLEDIEFNKKFHTYTDNPTEALCILTPSMMNKLLEFEKIANNFAIEINKTGEVYFSINRNLFSFSSTYTKLSGNIFEKFYDDIYMLLSMVEEIKSNNKVFKM